MKPTNGKASHIMIRNLNKKDNGALKEVRTEFSTEFNSVAVMKAVYGFIDQRKTIADQRGELEKLQAEVEQLKGNLETLKGATRDYLMFQEEKPRKDRELLATLSELITDSPKARKTIRK